MKLNFKVIVLIFCLCFIFFMIGVKAGAGYSSDEIYYGTTGTSVTTELNNLQTIKTQLTSLRSQGTAQASNILVNTSAVVKGTLINGSMANNGSLDWNPSSSISKTITPGYYSGGTISTERAYTAGYSSGVTYGTTHGSNIVTLGSTGINGPGSGTVTFNASGVTNYTSLTASNFTCSLTNVTVSGDEYHSKIEAGGSIGGVSYNASNGVVSVSYNLFNNRESIWKITGSITCKYAL